MRHPQEVEGDDPVNGSCDTLAYVLARQPRVDKASNVAYTKVCARSSDGISVEIPALGQYHGCQRIPL
jgi:hypothetical protein